MSNKYDLIIFDCDGTLVDSELPHCVVITELLYETTGVKWTAEYLLENVSGFGMERTQIFIEETGGVTLPDDFTARYIKKATEQLPALCVTTEHAEDVLSALPVPYCLASNGEFDNIVATLTGTGLDRFFSHDRIFNKDMVARPKPAPDLFLHAAETMATHPERCLVVEDSTTGVRGAKAAGMTVAGYVGAAHNAEKARESLSAENADFIIDSLREITDDLLAQSKQYG